MKKCSFLKNCITKLVAVILIAAFLLPLFCITESTPEEVIAGGKLTLAQAKSVSVAKSEKIEALEIKISSAKTNRDSAVRSLRERQRSMSTFRWSPLLSFKFPQTPTEAESFEFAYKPTQLEYQIKKYEHQITDEQLKEYEKVSNLYIQIIQSESQVKFYNQRITAMLTTIGKARAMKSLGQVSEESIKQLDTRLESLRSKKNSEETKLTRAKQKLGNEVGFSIVTGYTFDDTFAVADMARDNIEYLQNYAIERDETLYEAKMDTELALLAMRTNYSLMSQQYGGDMSMISSYIDQALAGSSINKRSFKTDYDAFLKKIDEPWQGKYRILFFSFPKEWFKGDTDGIRYIEDDPYVLHSAVLEYESALKEQNNVESELKSSVEEGYDSYISARKAYLEAKTSVEALQHQIATDEVRNILGTLSKEEYDAEILEYEEQQIAMNDALALYSTTLYSFDRTCCGGVSQFIRTETLAMDGASVAGSGIQTATVEQQLQAMTAIMSNQAHYSLRTFLEGSEFMLYVDAPARNDDEYTTNADGKQVKNPYYFPYTITHFALLCDGRQIGQKTALGSSIRHLTLSLEEVDNVVVRLYNGDEIIYDCTIDPKTYYGVLNIATKFEVEEADAGDVIGTYTIEDDDMTDMIKLRFTFDQNNIKEKYALKKEAAYYNLSADRNLYLFSDRMIASDQPFSYLSLIREDLDQLTMRLFDSEGTYIGGARFDTQNKRLIVDDSVILEDLQEAAAREILVSEKSTKLQNELDQAKELLNAAEKATSGIVDGQSTSYYKKRIEELQKQIDEVAVTITAEEVQNVIESRKDEVEKKINENQTEAGKTDEEKAEDVDLEMARAEILKRAAEQYVQSQYVDKKKTELEEALSKAKVEMQKARSAYWDSIREDPTLYAAYKSAIAEVNRLEKELENVKSMTTGNKEFETEVDKVLRNNVDEIYALAAHDLTNPMLYNSEPWQTALAQAENAGIATTDENIRYLVSQTDRVKEAVALRNQAENLTKERAAAAKNLAKLQSSSSKLDQNAAKQVQRMIEKYDEEIAAVKQRADDIDPVLVLKREQSN